MSVSVRVRVSRPNGAAAARARRADAHAINAEMVIFLKVIAQVGPASRTDHLRVAVGRRTCSARSAVLQRERGRVECRPARLCVVLRCSGKKRRSTAATRENAFVFVRRAAVRRRLRAALVPRCAGHTNRRKVYVRGHRRHARALARPRRRFRAQRWLGSRERWGTCEYENCEHDVFLSRSNLIFLDASIIHK